MKKFFDVNYYYIKTDSPSYIINKHSANLGHMKHLSHKIETYVLCSIKSNDNVCIDNVRYVFFKRNVIGHIKYNLFIIFNKPEYIIIHGMRYGLYSCFLKLLLPKSTNIIVQVHGFALPPSGIKKKIYQYTNKFIDGYFFTGSDNANDWVRSKVFKKDKVFEIMEGSTSFKFSENANRSLNSFIWVGRLNQNKDPITILKAFELYLNYNSSAKLTMVYSSYELLNEIKLLLKKNDKLKKAIVLLGKVNHASLEKLYNQHQYFLLGSHYEGSGYSLLEAMTCGCVPIVTKIPSFCFMTNKGDCGLLFPSGNAHELLMVLCKTQTINYLKYQKKVLKHVKDKLSHEAIANDILKTFNYLSLKKQE